MYVVLTLYLFLSNPAGAPGDYNIVEVLAPRPAVAMSEYELESVFRQLREYSSLYKDMISNYNHLMKRLKEEDARRSGNFALKKPHLPGRNYFIFSYYLFEITLLVMDILKHIIIFLKIRCV